MKLIGTTHLMNAEEVESLISKENPDIVGIELCEARGYAIFKEIKTQPTNLLGKITNSIKEKAKASGKDYGSDMKTAITYAKKEGKQIAYLDMPIQKIQELFLKIPQSEQEGFARELNEFESEELKDVNEEEVLLTMKSRYPIAFEFLINMRNLYIANQLLILQRNNPGKKIVAILGKGHIKLVTKLIGG